MAMISFFTTIVGVLTLQAVQAQVTLPHDLSAYASLLSAAPHYTLCDIPWMGYVDASVYQRMSILAEKNRIRHGDIAQWYTLIQSMCPSYTDMDLYEGLTAEFRSEMLARDIPYMPPTPYCNPLANTPTPHVPPAIVDPLAAPATAPVSPYDLAYKNAYALVDRSVPRLSHSIANNVRQLLNTYLPAQCLSSNPLLANQITTNMRFNLAYAENNLSDYYYPFY